MKNYCTKKLLTWGMGCQKSRKFANIVYGWSLSLKEILETRTKKIMNSLIRWEKYADPLRFSLEYFPWKCSNWSERVMHQRSKSFAFGSWLLKLLGSKRNLSGNSIWTNYISARICKNFVILTLIIMSSTFAKNKFDICIAQWGRMHLCKEV